LDDNNNNKEWKRRQVRFKTFEIDEHVIITSYLAAQNVPHSLSNFPEKVSLVVGSLAVLDSSIKKKTQIERYYAGSLSKIQRIELFHEI